MIRKFQKEDIGRVADIWLNTNIEAHSFISPRYWQDNLSTVKEMLRQAELYVFDDEGRIQGFVGLTGDYVVGIFVCHEAQGRGIGKQLLDFVKGFKTRLNLSVYEKNIRAVKFYQIEAFII